MLYISCCFALDEFASGHPLKFKLPKTLSRPG